PEHQVPVVRHQAVSQQPGRVLLQRFGQDALEGLVVAVLLEQRQPGHGAVQHVVDQSARGVTGSTRHAASLCPDGCTVNGNRAASPLTARMPSTSTSEDGPTTSAGSA